MNEPVQEGDLLWTPSDLAVSEATVSHYLNWLRTRGIVDCADYDSLWRWSVEHTEAFWASLWDYFRIESDSRYEEVVDDLEMAPGRKWFKGSKVNFAEHILRNEVDSRTAIYSLSELRPLEETSWSELAASVRIVASKLRQMGVEPGDRVCSIMPNIPETAIAMLAAISIGAVWSNAAPEFGVATILDRFRQIKPKCLFACDGYQFGGKKIDKLQELETIVSELSDSLDHLVFLPYLNEQAALSIEYTPWSQMLEGVDPGRDSFSFERVEYDHPLWILFSSGTTGLPKGIVHSHIGALMELMKAAKFARDGNVDDIGFFYTTTGWMMYNVVIAMLISGGSIVLYDGHPGWPSPDVLWKMASEIEVTGFGASPSYVQLMNNLGVKPNQNYEFGNLKSIMCTGSPASPENFKWFYENVKDDIAVASQSGGTEIVGAFVGASPLLPVYAGEIQTRCLGMDVEAWNDSGEPVLNEIGELICKTPFPSMPLYFLDDESGARYQEAYFERFDGVWCHGDFLKINSRGGCYISGRSDATLNRHGVRLGTSDLYRVVELDEAVEDSLVVCVELPGGEFFMPMFLQLKEGTSLSAELEDRLSLALRENASPRHVPDKYYAVPEIPYTLTGKKVEIPIRKLLLGWPVSRSVNPGSLRNPHSIDFFLNFVETTEDYRVPKGEAVS